jgi:hemerythrin-like metal-binding protein/PAS domain S-box-containing protein
MLPIVLVTILTFGIAGAVAYFNSRQAVDMASVDFRNERIANINSHIRNILSLPQKLLEQNAGLISSGTVTANDTGSLQKFFLRQSLTFPGVTSIYFGNTEGGLAVGGHEGLQRQPYVIGTEGNRAGKFRKSRTDRDGENTETVLVLDHFDARTRPWFRKAVRHDTGVWGDPYILFTGHDMAIAPSLAVRDREGSLMGVVGTDIFLSAFSNFLQGLHEEIAGTTYIVDSKGYLIASSADEKPFRVDAEGKPAARLLASESTVPAIAITAAALRHNPETGFFPQAAYESRIEFNNDDMRVEINPFTDEFGLEWIIVTAIPADAYLGPVDSANQLSIVLTAVSIGLIMLLTALLSRRIIRPIEELQQKSMTLARGDFDQSVAVRSDDEIGKLGRSFNKMAQDLKQLFAEKEAAHRDADLAQREAERNLLMARLAIKAADAGTLHYAFDTDQLTWDDRSLEIFGLTRETFDGSYAAWRDRIHPDDLNQTDNEIEQCLSDGSDIDLHYRIIRPDGAVRYIRAVGTVLRSENGELQAITGMHFDESDQVEQSRALREAVTAAETATNAKSQFLASMSHELRTPLNAVLGFAELMLHMPGSELDNRQREYLGDIIRAASHLLGLVNDILDLARIEANELNLSIEDVNATEIVSGSVAQVGNLGRSRKITIRNQLADELPVMVRTDEKRLRQLLINLLSNAIKYNRDGGTVIVSGSEQPNGFYRISVTDTGIGIAEKDQPKVFQMFHRLDLDATRSRDGAGIGLAVSRMLVENLAGRIGFESEVGTGSTFWIELPEISNDQILIWTDDLRVGVDAIDKDHQVIFRLANAIVFEDVGDQQLDGMIEELMDYTGYHFRREEKIMEIGGYPNLDEHRKFHRELIRKSRGIADDWSRNRQPETLQSLRRLLQRWWIGHIVNVDTSILQYAQGHEMKIRRALKDID